MIRIFKIIYELFGGSSEATVMASSNGHIECLKYLIEIGAPMPDDIIDKSINTKTNLAVIKYLRERGCSWSVLTSVEAARFNNMALLKFLHENNCPWDEQTSITAARESSIQCLVYALDNGCKCRVVSYCMDNSISQLMCRSLE